MSLLVAGGTGFLGRALVSRFRAAGAHVRVITRRPAHPHDLAWPIGQDLSALVDAMRQASAVVNLSGESLDRARWTPEQKRRIRESRVTATRTLAEAIAQTNPPPTFISGSAVGVYGTPGDTPLTEDSPAGSDFLATVVLDWEREALKAAATTRVVLLRTGVVLSRDGGALPKLALPFRFFAGGRVGSGRQYVSWIHLDDWTAMVDWAIGTPAVAGPLNATAPAPVTNGELAGALGRVLRRPAWLPAPPFAVRVAVGEMADAAILNGQRVLPAKARTHGFRFGYPDIESALRAIYGGPG